MYIVLTNHVHGVLYVVIYTRLDISMLSKYPKTMSSNITQVLFVSFDVLYRSTIMTRVRINKVQFSLPWINIFYEKCRRKGQWLFSYAKKEISICLQCVFNKTRRQGNGRWSSLFQKFSYSFVVPIPLYWEVIHWLISIY